MRKRVEETLDLLGLADLRDRPLRTLSGGQRQRVAIGSVLTTHPRVLVLDEPTSALDPGAAEEVLAALQRLVHDLGLTVLLAEHRLERVVQYADRVVLAARRRRGRRRVGDPAEVLRRLAGRAAGRRARPAGRLGPAAAVGARRAPRAPRPLRDRLADASRPTPAVPPTAPRRAAAVAGDGRRRPLRPRWALRGVDLARPAGRDRRADGPQRRRQVDAARGAGRDAATRRRHGRRRRRRARRAAARHDAARAASGWCRRTPADLLYAETVAQECAAGRPDAGRRPGTTAALLDRLAPGRRPDDQHPRDLSEGQRLALALAIVLAARPRRCCCSTSRPAAWTTRPSAGSSRCCATLAAAGHARSSLATHDVELVAEVADRVVVLADGEVVADGPTAEVVVVLARVRAAGREDPRAAAVADRRRGRRRAAGGGMSPRARVRAPSRLRPRSATALALVSAGRRRRVRLAAARRPRLGRWRTPATRRCCSRCSCRCCSAVVLAEIADGGIDAKAVALLGVLAAVGAALRPLGAGITGFSPVFL